MYICIEFKKEFSAIAPSNDNYPFEFLDDTFWSDKLP